MSVTNDSADQGATGQQQPNQQLAGKTSKKQQPVPMAAVTATHAQQQAGPYKGKPAPSATGFAASSVPDRVTSTDTGNTRQTSRRSAAEPMGTVNTQQANINETAGWQRVPWRWPFFNRREQPRMREEQPTYRARLDVSKMSVENAQHQDRYAMQKTAHMDAISDAIARAPTPSQSAADQVGMNAKQHRATVEKNEVSRAHKTAEQRTAIASELADLHVILCNMLVHWPMLLYTNPC